MTHTDPFAPPLPNPEAENPGRVPAADTGTDLAHPIAGGARLKRPARFGASFTEPCALRNRGRNRTDGERPATGG